VSFGECLRLARTDAYLSVAELARRAGVDRSAIGLYERDRRSPRLDAVVKLARALRLTPAQLVENYRPL
jgi:transcriptional regulator with XRE-family HTH domain